MNYGKTKLSIKIITHNVVTNVSFRVSQAVLVGAWVMVVECLTDAVARFSPVYEYQFKDSEEDRDAD